MASKQNYQCSEEIALTRIKWRSTQSGRTPDERPHYGGCEGERVPASYSARFHSILAALQYRLSALCLGRHEIICVWCAN
jgi:hypothetical protein